jgi:hypothetical protein
MNIHIASRDSQGLAVSYSSFHQWSQRKQAKTLLFQAKTISHPSFMDYHETCRNNNTS